MREISLQFFLLIHSTPGDVDGEPQTATQPAIRWFLGKSVQWIEVIGGEELNAIDLIGLVGVDFAGYDVQTRPDQEMRMFVLFNNVLVSGCWRSVST